MDELAREAQSTVDGGFGDDDRNRDEAAPADKSGHVDVPVIGIDGICLPGKGPYGRYSNVKKENSAYNERLGCSFGSHRSSQRLSIC